MAHIAFLIQLFESESEEELQEVLGAISREHQAHASGLVTNLRAPSGRQIFVIVVRKKVSNEEEARGLLRTIAEAYELTEAPERVQQECLRHFQARASLAAPAV